MGAILDFQTFKILTANRVQKVNSLCITVPNFVAIGQTVAEICRTAPQRNASNASRPV